MRYPFAAIFALSLALLLGGVDLYAANDRAAPYARGILWKVQRDNVAPSHLFGTIHLADPRVTELPPPVRRAFDESRHFMMELVPDIAGIAELAQSMIFADGNSLPDAVGAALYADAQAAFRKRGLPAVGLDRYKPWAVAVILSMPNPGAEAPLDLRLQFMAASQHKSVEGLETAQEQIAVFNELSLSDQRALLAATLREHHALDAQIEALVQAYLARDLARLQTLTETYAAEDQSLHQTVMPRLLAQRNRRMVERMRPRLRQGNAFIAVGAAHLSGPDGLLELLERDGYRVEAVY